MTKTKHSKFKNTGILFELLTRQITADILAGKEESQAKDLLFKYFKEDKELGREWELYKFLINEKISNESAAERAISVALKARERLNFKKLADEKYNLIKEIKEHYPINDLLKSNIKNYKVYASVYKVFENHTNNNEKFSLDEVMQARTCIIESLIQSKSTASEKEEDLVYELYKKQNEDIRLLSYKNMIDSMNKKYKTLDSNQKEILREYINNISNTTLMPDFINKHLTFVKNELSILMEKIDAPVTKIKVTEVLNQLGKIDPNKGVKDNHVLVLLLSCELINGIKKNI